MNVLFLSTWFPWPPDNGSKIRAYHLLRSLACSHRVTAVAFQPAEASTNGQLDRFDLDAVQLHPVRVDPFRHVKMPNLLKFSSPVPVAYWPSLIMRQTVDRVIASAQWDAVVAIQIPAASYALQLSTVPRVLDVDTSLSFQMCERYFSQSGSLNRWRTWVSWQKARQYETHLFRRFQVCTVVSSAELEHLRGMLTSSECRVQVNPNGVDCQYNRPGLAQPRPGKLIYNGALTYRANYDAMQYFLADIYPLIRQQVPEVSLTITGSTVGVDLSALALDASVELSGYVDDIRLPVAESSVCVAPIRQGGGTRLKILEAMALGTPVVATAKGTEGLQVKHNQHLLIADEPAEFAEYVVRLLQDATLRQQLATNARRLVERQYDWAGIGQHFVELVEAAAYNFEPRRAAS